MITWAVAWFKVQRCAEGGDDEIFIITGILDCVMVIFSAVVIFH